MKIKLFGILNLNTDQGLGKIKRQIRDHRTTTIRSSRTNHFISNQIHISYFKSNYLYNTLQQMYTHLLHKQNNTTILYFKEYCL